MEFMKKIRRSFFRRLYSGVGKHLPSSVNSNMAKKIRYWLVKNFVEYCGVNVNIEKGAGFCPDLLIGVISGIGQECKLSG